MCTVSKQVSGFAPARGKPEGRVPTRMPYIYIYELASNWYQSIAKSGNQNKASDSKSLKVKDRSSTATYVHYSTMARHQATVRAKFTFGFTVKCSDFFSDPPHHPFGPTTSDDSLLVIQHHHEWMQAVAQPMGSYHSKSTEPYTEPLINTYIPIIILLRQLTHSRKALALCVAKMLGSHAQPWCVKARNLPIPGQIVENPRGSSDWSQGHPLVCSACCTQPRNVST